MKQEVERKGALHARLNAIRERGIWSCERDSNPQPSEWKSDTLPIALSQRRKDRPFGFVSLLGRSILNYLIRIWLRMRTYSVGIKLLINGSIFAAIIA